MLDIQDYIKKYIEKLSKEYDIEHPVHSGIGVNTEIHNYYTKLIKNEHIKENILKIVYEELSKL